MKKLVPSTRGELTVVVVRNEGSAHLPAQIVKYVSIRELVNGMIAELDTPSNPVVSITIAFHINGAA